MIAEEGIHRRNGQWVATIDRKDGREQTFYGHTRREVQDQLVLHLEELQRLVRLRRLEHPDIQERLGIQEQPDAQERARYNRIDSDRDAEISSEVDEMDSDLDPGAGSPGGSWVTMGTSRGMRKKVEGESERQRILKSFKAVNWGWFIGILLLVLFIGYAAFYYTPPSESMSLEEWGEYYNKLDLRN